MKLTGFNAVGNGTKGVVRSLQSANDQSGMKRSPGDAVLETGGKDAA
jgi:hypothetical protein